MKFSAGNAQHIGAREQQQDAFGFSDPEESAFVAHGGFLGLVADGVGGLTQGAEASQAAVRTFLQAYRSKTAAESIPNALLRSLREANTAVLRVAREPSAEGAGTTLAAAVLHEHSLYWISAGDSRIYLLHGGKLTRVTTDHTYARQLDEPGGEGHNFPGGSAEQFRAGLVDELSGTAGAKRNRQESAAFDVARG